MIIIDLPQHLRLLALANQVRQYNKSDESSNLNSAFDWSKTPEGQLFWRKVSVGIFEDKPTKSELSYPKSSNFIYINNKNKKEYRLVGSCENQTNGSEGVKMILYADKLGILYCREESEFIVKFKLKGV